MEKTAPAHDHRRGGGETGQRRESQQDLEMDRHPAEEREPYVHENEFISWR